MGSLIGMEVDMRTNHPKELIDALYEEVFDEFPEDEEVDVVIWVKDVAHDEDGGWTLRVVDYAVARVGQEIFLDGVSEIGTEYIYQLAMLGLRLDEHGADAYLVMHKHPEGFWQASEKDHMVARMLAEIDFATWEGDPLDDNRRFGGFAAVNRHASQPVDDDDRMAVPIHGHPEILEAAEERAWIRLRVPTDTEDGARAHELRAEYIELIRQRNEFDPTNPDELGAGLELTRRAIAVKRELDTILDRMDAERRKQDLEEMLDSVPPEIQELMRSIRSLVDDVEIEAMPGTDERAGGFIVSGSGDGSLDAAMEALSKAFAAQHGGRVDADAEDTPVDIGSLFVGDEAIAELENMPADDELPEARPVVPDAFDVPDIKWLD